MHGISDRATGATAGVRVERDGPRAATHTPADSDGRPGSVPGGACRASCATTPERWQRQTEKGPRGPLKRDHIERVREGASERSSSVVSTGVG